MRLDGRARHFAFEKNTVSILEAALREGWRRPTPARPACAPPAGPSWSKARRTWTPIYALEDYEIARGYILTCQAYPVSDTITVDYDS